MKKLTTEAFIEKAKKIHGDKYDYSKAEYVDTYSKVCIICPEHGEFWQSPSNHLHKTRPQGCPKCGKVTNIEKRSLNREEFVKKAVKVHGGKYDYSKVEYVNYMTKVCIICPEHGEFWQTPSNHLAGKGCSLCRSERLSLKFSSTTEEFIKKAKFTHKNKYDYSKVEYTNNSSKVCIICPIHGEFWQTPLNHLMGKGCPKCKSIILRSQKLTPWEKVLTKMNERHQSKYEYDPSTYIDTHSKIRILCPIHGEFWQTPHSHIQGQGCPICKQSKLEKDIITRLNEEKVSNTYQYRSDWLGKQSIDFFLEDKNIAIECQGLQHYKAIDFFGGEENFHKQQERDIAKKKLCEEKGIKLYYYSDVGETEFLGEKVYNNLDELINEIKKSKLSERSNTRSTKYK